MERDRLRRERLDQGKTLKAFAAEIGVTPRVLQRAEQGSVPHPANARKIAAYFGKRPSEFWPAAEDAA